MTEPPTVGHGASWPSTAELKREIEALRAELHELRDAHEALRARFERFIYMPPELVDELVRRSRELAERRP